MIWINTVGIDELNPLLVPEYGNWKLKRSTRLS